MIIRKAEKARVRLAALAALTLLAAAACGAPRESDRADSAPPAESETAAPSAEPPAATPAPAPPLAPAPATSRAAAPSGQTPPAEVAKPDGGAQPAASPPPLPPPEPKFVMVKVGVGRDIPVIMEKELSSKSSKVGEPFTARVTSDVVTKKHPDTVIPAGSVISGTVAEVQSAKQFSGNARLALKFDRLTLPSGESVAITAGLAQMGEDTKSRTKKGIAGGAVVGALVGTIIGRDAKGALIGGAVGAGVGTAVVAGADNKDVVIPAGTNLKLEASEPFEVPVPTTGTQ